MLNLYLDHNNKWHLPQLVQKGPIRKEPKSTAGASAHPLLVFSYVIDALSGSLVVALPRTPSMGASTAQGVDELGATQTLSIDADGTTLVLRDTTLNIETYDFNWADPKADTTKLARQYLRRTAGLHLRSDQRACECGHCRDIPA